MIIDFGTGRVLWVAGRWSIPWQPDRRLTDCRRLFESRAERAGGRGDSGRCGIGDDWGGGKLFQKVVLPRPVRRGGVH